MIIPFIQRKEVRATGGTILVKIFGAVLLPANSWKITERVDKINKE